jgi:hypothetical protein
MAITGHACDEEDIMPHTFGLVLDEQGKSAADGKVFAALSLAEDRLDSMHISKASSSGQANEEAAHVAALLSRLRFRRALLQVGLPDSLGTACSGT